MYRLLALDLDGTLLRHDQVVDDRDLAAIRAVRAAGVVVTIVTGRLHSGSIAAAKACAIDGAIACMEGSHIVEVASGQTIAHHPMSAATTAMLRAAFREHRLAGFVFHKDAIHHDAAGERFASYVATWSPNMRMVESVPDDLPLAAVAIGEPDDVAGIVARLQSAAEELFVVSFAVWAYPGKHAVLVRAAGPNKGRALAELCRRAGCTVADAVAVGDWVNDIPMLEVAGRSFAMASAPDAVRAAATDVLTTKAGAGGGIAEAIERAWGIVAS